MKANSLVRLNALGQGVWLDYLSRELLDSGEIVRLIREDGLSGITSNPATFHKAIGEGDIYDADIKKLAREGKGALEIYEELAVADVKLAADFLRPLFDRTAGRDGFVSLEVSPRLAHDAAGTMEEARRLWGKVDRPNVLIKVPGTREGVPAIRELLAEGINVNVTLLFSLSRYREVAKAYLEALTERTRLEAPISRVASVASFFLSRIDVLVDGLLEKRNGPPGSEGNLVAPGEVAIACAKCAYAIYREFVGGVRYQTLADQGARPQRLLWASTGRKNPAYSEVKYVEPLIGPDTVNTMPLETIAAYRKLGHPELTLGKGVVKAQLTLERLALTGIDLETVAKQLEDEGVQKFVEPFEKLIASLEIKRLQALG